MDAAGRLTSANSVAQTASGSGCVATYVSPVSPSRIPTAATTQDAGSYCTFRSCCVAEFPRLSQRIFGLDSYSPFLKFKLILGLT